MATDSSGEEKPVSVVIDPWKWLAGMLLLIILLQVVDHLVGWKGLIDTWKHVSFGAMVFALLLVLLSHVLRAARIYRYLNGTHRQSGALAFPELFKVSVIHQFSNNFLPMRLGEATFVLLMKRYFDISWARSLSQLIWLRLLDFMVVGVVCLGVMLVGLPVVEFAFVAVCLSAGLVVCLVLFNRFSRDIFNFLASHPWLGKWLSPLLEAAPSESRLVLQLLFLTAASWFSKLCGLSIVILAFAHVPLKAALAGALGSELSGILPVHGLAGAGSFEAAFFTGISLVEGATSQWLSVAVNTHIFMLASISIITLASLPIPVVHKSHSMGGSPKAFGAKL